jgi:hypothetical protein
MTRDFISQIIISVRVSPTDIIIGVRLLVRIHNLYHSATEEAQLEKVGNIGRGN